MKLRLLHKWAKSLLVNNYFAFCVVLFILLINTVLLLQNGSWLFESQVLENYGDQRLYFELAYNILSVNNTKSLYTLGYPVFYIPFIIWENFTNDWRMIMNEVIFIQAFVIIPLVFFLIFRKLDYKKSLIIALIIVFYYFNNILFAPDPLLKYNFLGLIPLSEPLAILLLLLSYCFYYKLKSVELLSKKEMLNFILLGFIFGFTILIRTTTVILLVPIVLDMIFSKNFKKFLLLALGAFIIYIPQLIWNQWVSGMFFFNGYIWWEYVNMSNNMVYKQALYGFAEPNSFSLSYFFVNVWKLIPSYIVLIYLLLFIRPWKTKFEVFIMICTILFIVIHLAYWWSAASNLIDRFLLPNFFLLFFVYGQRLRKSKEI